ncbi:MAG TPA: ribosome maturation factor [Chitinophagaceae bacterium]|nr:ribosome maturation factor [Chitinophagaceae bacterium]
MKEGNELVPFSIFNMSSDIHQQIQQVEQLANTMLAVEAEYFLVQVKIKPVANIKVFIAGDHGISIEKCVQFNRKLYKMIEDAGLYPPGDFSLEVSSPGVDEPLRLRRQYNSNIGRIIEIIFNDGGKQEGKLVQVAEMDIIIEQIIGKGSKKETQQIVIPFNNIKTTTVKVTF